MEFARLAFRIYTLFIIGNSIQTPVCTFLQSIGKSAKSSVLSLSKQALFPVPSMLILSRLLGVTGVLCARPVSDCLAFLLAVILAAIELKSMDRRKQI